MKFADLKLYFGYDAIETYTARFSQYWGFLNHAANKIKFRTPIIVNWLIEKCQECIEYPIVNGKNFNDTELDRMTSSKKTMTTVQHFVYTSDP